MAYATTVQLRSRLGTAAYAAITDRVRDSSPVADDAVADELLTAASADLDQRLAGRYAVPIDTSSQPVTAAWLRDACLTLACWRGWLHHPLRSREIETVRAAYEALSRVLDRIAGGTESLPSIGALPSPTAGGGATVVGHERLLTEEGLSGL